MSEQEHPFAQYVRILGKGRHGSRALTPEESFEAMRLIMADEVEPIQLGAFLMLMRVKEETGPEVAAFVRAIRESLQIPADAPKVDLDWSSYAGKKRQLPWYLLSALLLSQNGVRIFMHGASGHTAGRIYTKNILPEMGIPVAASLDEAAKQMAENNFAYLDLENLSPKLHQIIEMRPLLGLRSPVHTIARELNPFAADYVIQGIFHPGYRDIHLEAGKDLGEPHMAVIKGEGGEIERNPDIACLVRMLHNGEFSEEEWPPMFNKRHIRGDELKIEDLLGVWRGEKEDEYGAASVAGTTAIALYLMGRADNRESAEKMAWEMWNNRNGEELLVASG
ncbi:glycosyl transferase family protein [Thiohalomonas denitrificans]|uniref:glycosyl transferase family protein n=1 Tax=Thiohalomonas denitrificans TaxID=415747 RepID=UPI0026F1C4F0|nr:glycosyl transferase family protein [Thiohalomonas denitrificans]